MTNFGKNIRKIRTVKKLSQSAFADLFKLKRASVGAYEEGRSEAKIDTVVEIAKYFSLSLEQLIVKELTVNEITHFDPIKATLKKAKNGNISHEIKLINLVNAKNYIKNFSDSTFLNSLCTLSLPNINPDMITFEHADCEMNNGENGIFKGDLLVCKKITDLKKELILDIVYVFVLNNEILVRRLVSFDTEIVVKSDTLEYSINAFNSSELIEVWSIEYIITKKIASTKGLNHRLDSIENKLEQLLQSSKKQVIAKKNS